MTTKPSNRVVSRPLSPFMLGQYYRLQLSSVLSFAHRLTGLALSAGTVFIAAWILSLAAGPEAYVQFAWIARSPIGLLLLLGWSWSLLYHMCNGIRHLVWDAGYGFEKKNVDLGGWIVVAASAALTALAWIIAYL